MEIYIQEHIKKIERNDSSFNINENYFNVDMDNGTTIRVPFYKTLSLDDLQSLGMITIIKEKLYSYVQEQWEKQKK